MKIYLMKKLYKSNKAIAFIKGASIVNYQTFCYRMF